MEITVTLVPSIDTTQWAIETFIGYATGWMRRYDSVFDEESPAPARLQPYLADAKTLVAKLLADYKEATAAPQTELIDKADKERDSRLSQVYTMTDAMLKMDGMPEKQQAAQTVRTGLDIYKPSSKAALRDESTQIQQWLEYVNANPAQQQALAALGLTTIVTELEQQNDEVIRLMDERASERQAQKSVVIADERKAADRAMKSTDKVLSALAIVDQDPERFAVLVNALIADQTEWRKDYEDRKRANKRVSVKSAIVGNHTYKVSSGWTWLRLVEENPKAFALDPEPSAPGVEPIVVPLRVVSLDKEAKKAGGLAVALNGVIVKPADEVDAGKTYELVAIPAE